MVTVVVPVPPVPGAAAVVAVLALVEQGVHEAAVGRHRATEVLGLGRPVAVRVPHPPGIPVVLDHARVLHRDVVGALVEVVDGVTALAHDRRDQRVGLVDRAPRVVDELALDLLPVAAEALAGLGVERPEVELLVPLAALGQLGLGLALGARPVEHAVVLGSERLLQLLGAFPPREHESAAGQQQHDDHHDDDDQHGHDSPSVGHWFMAASFVGR